MGAGVVRFSEDGICERCNLAIDPWGAWSSENMMQPRPGRHSSRWRLCRKRCSGHAAGDGSPKAVVSKTLGAWKGLLLGAL